MTDPPRTAAPRSVPSQVALFGQHVLSGCALRAQPSQDRWQSFATRSSAAHRLRDNDAPTTLESQSRRSVLATIWQPQSDKNVKLSRAQLCMIGFAMGVYLCPASCLAYAVLLTMTSCRWQAAACAYKRAACSRGYLSLSHAQGTHRTARETHTRLQSVASARRSYRMRVMLRTSCRCRLRCSMYRSSTQSWCAIWLKVALSTSLPRTC